MSIQIEISLNDYYELRNLNDGVYYPLKNLVNRADFNNIVQNYKK